MTHLATVDPTDVADCYATLARCFDTPDEAFLEAIHSGELDEALTSTLGTLGLDVDPAPPVDDRGDLLEGYRRTFEGYDGPSAPPVESVYEPWWDGQRREILSGPAATDMRRRFEALEIEPPGPYPADHLALELEYASLLLEAGNGDAYAAFHREHFDWIPDFVDRVEATVDDPFYAWIVSVLERTIDRVEAWMQTSLEAAGDVEAGSIPPTSERDPSEVNGDEQ